MNDADDQRTPSDRHGPNVDVVIGGLVSMDSGAMAVRYRWSLCAEAHSVANGPNAHHDNHHRDGCFE